MKTSELTIKLVDKITTAHDFQGNVQHLKSTIEHILHEYNIETKETLPAVVDNMGEMIMLYLATKNIEGLSKETLKGYGRTLAKFSNALRKNVQDVSVMDIRIYLSDYSNSGVTNSTLATYTDVLRGFFNWLESEEYINKSPMKKIKSIKVEKRMRKALTKEQFEILRTGALTLRQKALLEVMYSTGCRLTEVEGMKKSDIDWQKLTLKVIGKGNKERTVYLSAAAQVHLNKYILSRSDKEAALFVTQRKPITNLGRRAIQKEINKITVQSELGINIYPHLIRHTFSTHMLNSGMDITVLQKILGHEDSATTLIYASLDNQTIEHQYRKFS